jgi:hypothetical protein
MGSEPLEDFRARLASAEMAVTKVMTARQERPK